MSRLKPLECVNCGAPLERSGLQCEYCGTAYAAEGAPGDTVNIYADGTVLAKAIKHIDIDEMSRYPEYASPPISLNKWNMQPGAGFERRNSMHQFKVGDRVRFKGMGNVRPAWLQKCYPKDGTIGTVSIASDDDDQVYVQWPEGSTSGDDMWWAFVEYLELVADDPT